MHSHCGVLRNDGIGVLSPLLTYSCYFLNVVALRKEATGDDNKFQKILFASAVQPFIISSLFFSSSPFLPLLPSTISLHSSPLSFFSSIFSLSLSLFLLPSSISCCFLREAFLKDIFWVCRVYYFIGSGHCRHLRCVVL